MLQGRCCQGADHLGFEPLLVGTTSYCRPGNKKGSYWCYPRERYPSAGQRATGCLHAGVPEVAGEKAFAVIPLFSEPLSSKEEVKLLN